MAKQPADKRTPLAKKTTQRKAVAPNLGTAKASKPAKVKIRKRDQPQLEVRQLTPDDYAALETLQRTCFAGMPPWTKQQFDALIEIFPEGQICIIFEGELVASSSTLIVDRKGLPGQHSYAAICADNFSNSHDPDGDTLYGIEICVAPKFRGKKLARRLYDARKDIAIEYNLRSMLIAGRMPGYAKHHEKLSPTQYAERVVRSKIRDQVITAQLANGFSMCHVINNYLPSDAQSLGHALLMEWHNSGYVAHKPGKQRIIDDVRVASVQYEMRPLESFDDFARQCEFFIETASDYRCDFICFPELLTNQLLGLVERGPARESAQRLSRFTLEYEALFSRLAISYNVNIIGGTHLLVVGDQVHNDAYLFRRDGSIERQRKVHVTPAESRWWGVSGGDDIQVFDTDCGKIAILICYDIEFPELSRIARTKGAQLFFVPFNTDIRPAYLRVRNCAQARCIENNVYCVLSGPVGNLPQVDGLDIHYSQACILTPSDIPYSRDGIAAEATPNVETMLIHELDMSLLRFTEREGAVRTWLDRRHDLYQIQYRGGNLHDLKP